MLFQGSLWACHPFLILNLSVPTTGRKKDIENFVIGLSTVSALVLTHDFHCLQLNCWISREARSWREYLPKIMSPSICFEPMFSTIIIRKAMTSFVKTYNIYRLGRDGQSAWVDREKMKNVSNNITDNNNNKNIIRKGVGNKKQPICVRPLAYFTATVS